MVLRSGLFEHGIGARCSIGLFALAVLLAGCSNAEEREDVGYDDGYSVGYNTTCQIRATLIDGDFKNEAYATAYARGLSDGIVACQTDRSSQKQEP